MIIIYTKDNQRFKFCVPDEDKLLMAWKAVGGDPAYAHKAFQFTENSCDGKPQVFKIKIGNIKSLIAVGEAVFEDVVQDSLNITPEPHPIG